MDEYGENVSAYRVGLSRERNKGEISDDDMHIVVKDVAGKCGWCPAVDDAACSLLISAYSILRSFIHSFESERN